MKFFVQIIIILVVVNFATTGFVLAEKPSEKALEGPDSEVIESSRRFSEMAGQQETETVAKVVADTQKIAEAAAKEAQKQAEAAQKQADEVLKQAQAAKQQAEANLLSALSTELALESTKKLSRSSGDRILVIPTSQMKPEDLVAIMEDMSIMSRIFDKKVGHVSPPSVPILGDIPMIGRLFSRGDGATEGIYLQGFGAIFFMGVNFPLSPPIAFIEQIIEKDVDPVWTQTKREMYKQEEGKRILDIGSIQDETILLSVVGYYDVEKVDEFKRAVTKTLKHAANIRNLKPDEWVVVTVTGAVQPSVIEQKIEQPGKEDEDSRIIQITPHVSETSSRYTILTLRVKKSDIDSYSNGELDFDKFRQKIVIFTYPYLSGAASSASSRL